MILHAESDNEKHSRAQARVAGFRWAALTWDHLGAWAGGRPVQRGQSYQRQGRVKELAISRDRRLLAMVIGGERYTVSV